MVLFRCQLAHPYTGPMRYVGPYTRDPGTTGVTALDIFHASEVQVKPFCGFTGKWVDVPSIRSRPCYGVYPEGLVQG